MKVLDREDCSPPIFVGSEYCQSQRHQNVHLIHTQADLSLPFLKQTLPRGSETRESFKGNV